MTFTEEEVKKISEDEEGRWVSVYKNIVTAMGTTLDDYEKDDKLARELNAEIVATTRDEEKVALMGQERVAFGLSQLRREKTKELESLREQPYFARVVTREENRDVEFRLGTASFPEERIIDWRKAPISKLYYDYKEKDEFCVTIQGREREGNILLRRSYQGKRDNLVEIDTAQGALVKTKEGWANKSDKENFSRQAESTGHLPPILSLITADQFELITSNAKAPLFIQGIAGSGKTTVALHRLAWLLHKDNSDNRAERSLVVMKSAALKAYVQTTLPELDIHGVPIRTYHEWVGSILEETVGPRPRKNKTETPFEAIRFKNSTRAVELLKKFILEKDLNENVNFIENYFSFLMYVLNHCENELNETVRKYLSSQCQQRFTDLFDETILLHFVYHIFGYYPSARDDLLVDLDHLVIDEVQDLTWSEVTCLIHALSEDKVLTLVGDMAQQIEDSHEFESWNDFLQSLGYKNITPIELNVSYRTTQEILELASLIRSGEVVKDEFFNQCRHGPSSVYIKLHEVATLPYAVKSWVEARQNEDARVLNGIICRTHPQAKYLFEHLRKIGVSVKLGYGSHFDFSPGVVVTDVANVKGLEFRNVLVVDPSPANYSLNHRLSKNLLYVAVTRAEKRLDFIGLGDVSSILPEIEMISAAQIKRDVWKS